MENSASDLSDLQGKKSCSSEQFSDGDGMDIDDPPLNENAPANVEGGSSMPNQGSTSGTKTLNLLTSWTDSKYHASMVQVSKDITATGQPSASQIGKRRREDIEKMYHDRQREKDQCMKMILEYNEISTQKLKLEQERFINLNEPMCQQLQSQKMMEQLRSVASSLAGANASLNLQLDCLYGNVLEVYKTKSELKAEKDEFKRENELLKNQLNRLKNKDVQWKRDNEYGKNILEIEKDKLRRIEDKLRMMTDEWRMMKDEWRMMKDEVRRAEQQPVHLGFGDRPQEPSKVSDD